MKGERHGWMKGSIHVRRAEWMVGWTCKRETATDERMKIMREKGKDKEIIIARVGFKMKRIGGK